MTTPGRAAVQLGNPDVSKRPPAAALAGSPRADAGVDAIFAPRLGLLDANPVTRALLVELLYDKGFDVVAGTDPAALPSAVDAWILAVDGMPQHARRPAWLLEKPAVPVIVLDRPPVLSGLGTPLGFTPDARLDLPVPPRKLVATIRQVLSRVRVPIIETGDASARAYRFDGWTLHVGERRLQSMAGRTVLLGRQECEALKALLSFPRQVLTREQLSTAIWGTCKSRILSPRMLDGPIRRLRRHLGEDVRYPRLIKTVVGVGYRLDADVDPLG
ncbi:MAG: winged helix-turn-helix domain-containing protein [Thiobacillus sp.]